MIQTCLFIFFLTPILNAYIELETSINDVFHRGSHELAGSITANVQHDVFPDVSPANPAYLRFALDHNAVLADTLVDQNAAGSLAEPILLALRLDGGNGLIRLVAPADTVSIVRWVAGEAYIWLRIQQPTHSWLDDAGTPTAPSNALEVSFSLGLSARFSDLSNDADAAVNESNLPFNTRNPAASEGDFAAAASALMCTDLRNSTLTADSSLDSLLTFDPLAFDADAEISPGIYGPGTVLPVVFFGDFPIARGKTRLAEAYDDGPIGGGIVTSVSGDFRMATNGFTFTMNSLSGGNYLDTPLYEGSRIRLTITEPGYGFDAFNGPMLTNLEGYLEVDPASAFDLNGYLLYRSADLVYTGSPRSLDFGQTFELNAGVIYHLGQPVDEFLFDWEVILLSHDNPFDDPPYDHLNQWRRCTPSEYLVPGGQWKVNDCEINSATLIGNQLHVTGSCPIGVKVYSRDSAGNFTLLQSGVIVDGTTVITLDDVQPNLYYGVVPLGAPADDLNFVGDLAIVVPTLTELGLAALVGLMLCVGLMVLRRRR